MQARGQGTFQDLQFAAMTVHVVPVHVLASKHVESDGLCKTRTASDCRGKLGASSWALLVLAGPAGRWVAVVCVYYEEHSCMPIDDNHCR